MAFPAFIEPMKATLAAGLPPDQDDYAFEFKWDGYRAVCLWDGKSVKFKSRNRLNFTEWYPELTAIEKVLKDPIILDGEIVALEKSGRPNFQILQQRSGVRTDKWTHLRMKNYPVKYFIFDVLYFDGRLVTPLPYIERRKILDRLKLNGPLWQTPPYTVGEGDQMLEVAKEHGFEGLIAKRASGIYEIGRRSKSWLKIKLLNEQEFVVGGFTEGKGSFKGTFGSLLLGYYERNGAKRELRYAGNCGTGFSWEERIGIRKQLDKIRIPGSPFSVPVPPSGGKPVFVKPALIAQVQFTEMTQDRQIRHPSFKGFREDKRPEEVVLEAA